MSSRKMSVIFANFKSNIGDFAILHSILRELHGTYPGAQIDVYPHGGYAVDQMRLAAFRRDCEFDFTIAGETFWAPLRMTPLRRVRRALRLWPALQASMIEELASLSSERARVFAQYDAIYLAGGEQWGGAQLGVSMFGTLLAISRANTNIYSYPFSLSQRITAHNNVVHLREHFGAIRHPLVVRDRETAVFLGGLGIQATAGADCVLSMHDLADQVAPSETRRRVVFSITGQTASLHADLREFVGALPSELCPALMTTCESEDGAVYQSVASELGIEYIAPDGWMRAISALKSTDLFVTNRLHGLIFGTLAGTAVLPVTDRRKSRAFADDSNVPVTANKAAEITSVLLETALAQSENIKAKLGVYKQKALRLPRSPIGSPQSL